MNNIRNKESARFLLTFFGIVCALITSVTVASSDSGPPNLSEPLQREKFFDPARLSVTGSTGTEKPLLEPQLSVSHEAREEEAGIGVKQTMHRVHGEAGGKLNILGDISLVTVAKIPVYTHETKGATRTSEGVTYRELFRKSGSLSWRSELGVPLKEGLNLNFFYDNSTFGRLDKPGVEEREEKFGTKFIFKFK